MPRQTRHFFEFGPFRLDSERHRLLQNGTPIAVPPKAMEALLLLVRNQGTLLERESLIEAIWAGSFVEDANLTVAISQLRKLLGQNGDGSEYIETIPRMGYRFVAEVHEVVEAPTNLIVEKHTRSRTVIEEEFVSDPPVHTVSTVPQVRQRQLLQRAGQYKAHLLIAGVTIVILAGVSLIRPTSEDRKSLAATPSDAIQIRSLAVLPPRVLNKSDDDTALSLGMADALISKLAGLRRLTVRPTSAIARYVATDKVSTEIGRALSVDAVLEGTLQHDSGRTRFTFHLIDVRSGGALWSGTVEEAETNIFKLQDFASQKIAEALSLNLTNDEKNRLLHRKTLNPEAYANYLKGCYYWGKRGIESVKSLDYFRKAIALDPTYAEAYAGLAGVNAVESIPSPEAEVLIARALQLDDSLAEAHATNGFIRMFHHWDWNGAREELDRAVELDPNSEVAHHWRGAYLSLIGNLDAAKAEMHQALEINPVSLIVLADLGQLYYFSHDYDQALTYCTRALAIDPRFEIAHLYLFDIYRMKGMNDEALRELALAEYPAADTEKQKQVQEQYVKKGFRGLLLERLDGFKKSEDPKLVSLRMAQYLTILGESEEALRWLEVMPERPNFLIPYCNVDPIFDSLRGTPRFEAVMQRMGLRQATK